MLRVYSKAASLGVGLLQHACLAVMSEVALHFPNRDTAHGGVLTCPAPSTDDCPDCPEVVKIYMKGRVMENLPLAGSLPSSWVRGAAALGGPSWVVAVPARHCWMPAPGLPSPTRGLMSTL